MPVKKNCSPNLGAFYFTDRLTKALACMHEYPFTFVHAPLGYGKTIAVRELLRGVAAKVIWVGVPQAGESVFWREFCRALRQALPGQTATVQTLLRMGYPADAVLAEAACDLILSLDFGSKTVLVVDDIHLLHPRFESEVASPGIRKADIDPAGDAASSQTWQHGVTSGGMGKLCELLAGKKKSGLHIVCISRYPYGDPGILQSLQGQPADSRR